MDESKRRSASRATRATKANASEEMINNPHFQLELPPLNVLVAEDGLANRVLARGLLTREGHQVTLAENGRQALSHLLDSRYDLVLMDVDMPVMDGLSATRRIRDREAGMDRRTLVVALTSNENRDECLEAGMDAFLAKPFDLEAFHRVAAVLLQQRQRATRQVRPPESS
jgi:CheY-like chemotaxis protein